MAGDGARGGLEARNERSRLGRGGGESAIKERQADSRRRSSDEVDEAEEGGCDGDARFISVLRYVRVVGRTGMVVMCWKSWRWLTVSGCSGVQAGEAGDARALQNVAGAAGS